MTDMPDYYPGDVVVITGTGWWPGERVSLKLDQHPTLHEPYVFYSTADSTGSFVNADYVVEEQDLGTSFDLFATGLSSGLTATTFFTDSPKVGSVSLSSQSGSICSDAAGKATYTVTVDRGSGGGSSGAFTATLSLTTALPSGVTHSFSPNPVSFTPGQNSRTATLTLESMGPTSPGATGFTVRAATSASDFATGTELLQINEPPSITCPASITRNSDVGSCGAVVSFAASATGTPSPTITYSQDPGTLFAVGTTTVTATATNACGSTSCTFTVTVLDNEAPAISATDMTGSTDPGRCDASIATLGATATDNCPGVTLVGTRSDAAAIGAPFPQGTTTVTWTATDAHGNTKSATQLVTVQDTENPTISAPGAQSWMTGPASGSCDRFVSDAELGSPTANDNCSVTVVRTGVPAGNLFPVGTTTITYTATDPSGNGATATQTVTVVDDTKPTISVADIERDTDPALCSAAVASLGATAADNCDVASFVGTRSDAAALSDPFPAGTTTISWLATDVHGNTASATQTVTVTDRQNPSMTTANLTVTTDPGACFATVAALGTTATDNCAVATLVGVRDDGGAIGDPFPKGTTTIAWTATDVHGNDATATQVVTVNDEENPTLTAPGPLHFTTGAGATECGALVNDSALGSAAANDNCSVTVTRGFVPVGNLFPVGTTTITYTATDPSGNSATATQTVTVVDDTPPTIATGNLERDTDAGACNASIASLGTTAADNCDVESLVGTRSDGAALGEAFPKGTTTIQWLATDIHGNTAAAIQTVTVTDHENPTVVAADLSMSTDPGSCAAIIASLGASAADACGVVSSVGTRSDGAALGDPFPQGTTTITWLATDTSGNTAGAMQHVMVVDSEHPTIAAPAPLSLTTGPESEMCGVHVGDAALGSPVAQDNCSVVVSRIGVPAGNLFPVGVTTITYTALDPSGNPATATQTVTVTDDTPPTIIAPDHAVGTDAGACAATIASLGASAADHCGIQSLVGTRGDGAALTDPFPKGTTTITWVATDMHGNQATATADVTVEDHEAPTIAAPAAVTAATGTGARICGAVLSDEALGTPTASDNCEVSVTRTGVPEGHLFPVGVTTITYTATDLSGNSASTTQTVTVVDDTAPTLEVPAAVAIGTGAGATTCAALVTETMLGVAVAMDNCSVTLVRTGVPADHRFPVGTTTVTYTATDPSGNTVSATQIVTVTDTTPPSLTASNRTLATDAGRCDAVVASWGAAATDNCGTPTLTGVRGDGLALGDPYPKGVTTIVWTATDAAGLTAALNQTITVTNATPVATITGPSSGFLVPVGTPVPLTATFTDEAGDVHTATWSCDALSQAGVIHEASRTVNGSMTFNAAGVYMVKLVLTDQCQGTSTTSLVNGLDAMIVVYDPSAGFVTGGGWIQSPAGSYAANPGLSGKANFGFVSKYKKGASVPTGETEFQFKAGDFNFHSSSYDWLVISGARAQFKGTGTINGAGNYGFLLSSVDGEMNGGGGKDKFRIKVTDKATGVVVYDNQMGAPDTSAATTLLGGGSIVIQTSGGRMSSSLAIEDAGSSPAAGRFQNRPNPFNPETTIDFAMASAGNATLRVFDVRGALVRTLVEGSLASGAHTVRWNGRDRHGLSVPSGVYYALLETNGTQQRIRMVLVK